MTRGCRLCCSRWLLCVFGLLPALYSAASVQAESEDRSRIDSLFQAGEYERVELEALRLSSREREMPKEEMAWIQVTAGFAMIMLDREDDARTYFESALDHDPALTLDPIRISPKFRVVFDDVKAGYRLRNSHGRRSETVTGPRSSSRVMNLLLPGSGHFNERRHVRGVFYAGAQIISLGLLITQISDTRDSRADYLAEADSARIKPAYDRYNEDYRTAWLYGFVSAAVYFSSQVDLALLKSRIETDESALGFSASPLRDGARATLRIRW